MVAENQYFGECLFDRTLTFLKKYCVSKQLIFPDNFARSFLIDEKDPSPVLHMYDVISNMTSKYSYSLYSSGTKEFQVYYII